ncbi:hypothetical protein NQZ68_026661 [Dissostichus eleginoides]|nr:hypothetical protein NQZ68_026661 [Dissostichus eleginoides]
MSLSGQEFSQWHQHRHLKAAAVKSPVTSAPENMHTSLKPGALFFGYCPGITFEAVYVLNPERKRPSSIVGTEVARRPSSAARDIEAARRLKCSVLSGLVRLGAARLTDASSLTSPPRVLLA